MGRRPPPSARRRQVAAQRPGQRRKILPALPFRPKRTVLAVTARRDLLWLEVPMPKNFKEAAGFLLGFAIAGWLLLPLVGVR